MIQDKKIYTANAPGPPRGPSGGEGGGPLIKVHRAQPSQREGMRIYTRHGTAAGGTAAGGRVYIFDFFMIFLDFLFLFLDFFNKNL